MIKDVQSVDVFTHILSTQWDSSWPRWLNRDEQREIFTYWKDRFGISRAVFNNYLLAASSRTIYLIKKSEHILRFSSIRIQNIGLPFIRDVAGYLKPTTWAVQRFGYLAQKNVISIDCKLLKALVNEGEIKYPLDISSGYVIIAVDSNIWGCALFLEPDRLLCRFPKALKRAKVFENF